MQAGPGGLITTEKWTRIVDQRSYQRANSEACRMQRPACGQTSTGKFADIGQDERIAG